MYSEKAGWLVGDSHLVVKKPSRNHGYSWPKAGELYKRWLACCLKGTSHAAVAKPADSVFTAPVPGVMQFILEVICSHCCRLVCGVDACACTSMWMSAFKYPLIQSDANTSGQRNRWLCVHPPNTSRNMCTYILIPSCVAEWRNTHAVTRKNIFLLRKSYVMLSFFCFSFPLIPRDKWQPFNPRRHFHFIHSLSHHFPSFFSFPHSYSFSFFLYFRQHLVSQL